MGAAAENEVAQESCMDKYMESYAATMVRRPQTWCCSCCGFIFLMAVVSSMAGMMNIVTDEDEAWMIMDAESTQTYKAWSDAKWQAKGRPDGRLRRLEAPEDGDGRVERPAQTGFVSEQFDDESDWWGLSLLYKSNEDASETVFTPARLKEMCRLEKFVASQPDTWVLRDSASWLFYKNRPEADSCAELPQHVIDTQVQTMYDDVVTAGTGSRFARFVTPSFAESATKMVAYTRTHLEVTGKKGGEEKDSQADVTAALLEELGLSYGFLRSALQVEDDRFQPTNGLRVRLVYNVNEMDTMIWGDFGLSIGAIFIVFWIVYFHLGSSFIASVAMFQIIMSLPVSGLLYRPLIDYFEFLHILVVYLVLGIGADDVFVLVDTFRHISEEHGLKESLAFRDEDLVKVLKATLMRAGQAIFNTSFTTTAAFLSTSVSKVMPMRTCGYYAALCIMMNYIFTLTLTPAALVIYHKRLEGKRCCCPAVSERQIQEEQAMRRSPSDPVKESQEEARGKKGRRGLSGCIEAFLEKYYIPMMSYQVGPVRIFALIIAVIMGIVAIQGVYHASQLTPPSKPEVWLPDNHMLLGVTEFWSDTFLEADYESYGVTTFVWGIEGVDTSDFQVYKPSKNPPKAIFDSQFDPTTAEAHAEILDVCNKIRTLQCEVDGCTGSGNTLMFNSQEKAYSCFLEDMKAELEEQGRSLPTGDAFVQELKNFVANADPDKYSSEVCPANYEYDVGIIDGQLKYVSVKLRTRMIERESYGRGVRVRDLIQDFVDGRQANAPAGLKTMKFHADGRFANFDLSSELIKGLFSGIAIAFPLSFLVLLASTGNIVVAFYAVVCVACIVFCVLGFCKSAMDWDLGIGEAIAGVIVIGYSVDYVVHLAHIYCEAGQHGLKTRAERANFAIKNMGSTIFAGALTTAGSGMIMFACFFMFFFKMAILISVTIMYSFLFSMGMFVAVLWLIGPEGNFGDVCCCFKKDNKVHPETYSEGQDTEKQAGNA